VNTPIAPPRVPAPGSVVAAGYRATIDPMEAAAAPELKALLPAEQPLDKAFVTVEARFDGQALRKALQSDTGDGKTRPLPGQWWRDTTALFDVKLQRQERLPSGEWGPEAEVKPAPGRMDILSELRSVQGPPDMEDLVLRARASESAILRPAFYHTIAGPDWAAPSAIMDAGAEGGLPPEVDRKVKERRLLVAERERVQKLIEGLGTKGTQAPSGRTNNAGGGGGGAAGGRGGRGGGGGGGAAQTVRDPQKDQQDKAKNLEDRLRQTEGKIRDLEDRLHELGFDESGKRVVKAAPATPADQARTVLESPAVQLWAHDLTVESGKTYRYRVQVAVNNPAFGRASTLVAEQQDLAKHPLAYSDPSEWSAQVRIMDDRYYFVTGASEPDALSAAHASVELYEFFYGYYRRGVATVEPGDMLMAKLTLPEGSKLPIYDLMAAPKEGAGAQPAPEQPAGGGRRDEGRGARPVGKGAIGMPQQVQQGQAGIPVKPVLPENVKPWTKPLTASVDAVLLDVARPPSASDTSAILRVAGGQIETRDPAEDRTSELYKRVAQSAKEGENQKAPGELGAKPAEQPGQPLPVKRAQEPPKPPKGAPAGGAGGG
jgi:hypothetical protein